ncbi:MAG TPA: type II secretion system protein N [Steroidobacteraceae bacterium]|nr:type II secretion system protein N [Steroidobacteraceae bacterium]
MKRGAWIALLAAVAFIAIVIARMPAAWFVPTGRGAGSCGGVDGSLWSGTCTDLTVSGTPLGDVSWELHPLRLFLGKLAAHVNVVRGAATASADVEVGLGKRLTARNVVADLPLDPRMMPGVPASLHGRAHVELALAQLEHGAITQLQGRIEAHDLEDRSGANTPLGSYVVTFPGGSGDQVGKLRDLDGPLALEGTLRLTQSPPGFELEGLIAPRRGAPPEIVNNIRYFGSPDASGRRPFSLSGTF